jgi:hypothetical protein
MTNWPDDADGAVLRRLEESGFDFSKPCLIHFEVDFETWPPAPAAVSLLSREYPSATLNEPDGDDEGYIDFQVYAIPSYSLVTGVQQYVTDLMAPFHGECLAWGVWQEQR